MRYRLALDIGTASCGLIAVRLGEDSEPNDIVFHALHIFSEPVLPPKSGGVGLPKKAARRQARLARRIIDRRARRLRRIALLAKLLDLDPDRIATDSGQRIHRIRALAATERIELDDLVRVLLKLAKRRGYAGGFKTRKEGDEGVVEPGINQVKAAMREAGCQTIGQYLRHRFEKGETLKLKEAGLYAHRDMLVEEFNAIWNEQARHHPILRESRPDLVMGGERSIREQFFNAIFHQRPLKSVAPMVGNCLLERSLPRAPMAQPAMQAFRIEKQLADLRWGMGRKAEPLSREQRAIIREMLNDPAEITKDGKLTFKKIYAELEKKGLMPTARRSLNLECSSREDLTGNRTLRAMRDLGVIDEWRALNSTTQLRIINFLADLGSPGQADQPNWHERFTKTIRVKNQKAGRWEIRTEKRTLDPKLVEFVTHLVNSGKFDRLSKMGFDTGRASYSIRALEKLIARISKACCDEHAAVQHCYPPAEQTGELLMQLPPHKPTGNVVVDVALGVVRRAVNEALAALGEPPAEIIVELSRDMALGLKARGEIENKIDKNRRRKENARKELRAHGKVPTERNVLRYLLWEQQDKKHCPYCPATISLEQALDGNATNFEHILPRSLTRVGKQRNHLVLAHRSCNDAKGNRTPFEAIGHDEERWKAVEYCASVLRSNKQLAKARLLTLRDYEHETLDDESITEFTERQFAETSWISKLAAQWLKQTCTNVAVSRGTLTAHLRRIWKLETVIAQARFEEGLPVLDEDGQQIPPDDFKRYKAFWEGHSGKEHECTDRRIDKRIDHRHHLIDALVIAQTSRSLYQRMAKHYKELAERRQAGEPVRMKLFVEPPLRKVREHALRLVREAVIWYKPDRYIAGALFQGMAYKKVAFGEDRSRMTVRAKLIELTDSRASLDKTRKRISDIASPDTRDIVSKVFEARVRDALQRGLQESEAVKEALSTPIPDHRYLPRSGKKIPNRFEITHVRVYQRSGRGFLDGENSILVDVAGRAHQRRNHSKELRPHWKHYISAGYACVSLIFDKGVLSTEKSKSVSMFEATRPTRAKAIRGDEVRIFRGDTLLDPSTGRKVLVQQILADAKVRVSPITEARIWKELGEEAGGIALSASKLALMKKV